MVAENWQSIEEWVSSESSVTKLGEICHFGEILLHFGSFEKVRLLFGNILNLLWHILSGFSANVQCGKWPNIESINWSSGHTEWEKERGMCVCDRCRESKITIEMCVMIIRENDKQSLKLGRVTTCDQMTSSLLRPRERRKRQREKERKWNRCRYLHGQKEREREEWIKWNRCTYGHG